MVWLGTTDALSHVLHGGHCMVEEAFGVVLKHTSSGAQPSQSLSWVMVLNRTMGGAHESQYSNRAALRRCIGTRKGGAIGDRAG